MSAIIYIEKNSEISHSDISESSLRFLAVRTAVHGFADR